MKPRVFIGSSREGCSKARIIKKQLSMVAECQLWDEGFFENNKSSFESLSEGAVLFDFAILVATDDDIQLKRNVVESIARDNIIFEFGLYIGRLGRNRCFFVKEKGLDLPSDLYGIALPEFINQPSKNGKSLKEVSKEISKRISILWNTYELSFIPSTVLAVGYFENFVLMVCRELMNSSKREVDGKSFSDFMLHIVLPDELPNNFYDQVVAYLGNKKLNKMAVETTTRSYNFYLDYSQAESECLELYDLPTTLSALKKAIEMAIPKTFVGESQRERILKKKEMNNFCRSLDYLIKENPITKGKVVIEFIDVK
jgi:hypothetical protein